MISDIVAFVITAHYVLTRLPLRSRYIITRSKSHNCSAVAKTVQVSNDLTLVSIKAGNSC